jgi:hypothetical protein
MAALILPALLVLSASLLRAQTTEVTVRDMIERSNGGEPRFLPEPSDVLTPNVRRNTPNLKIGLRAGFNRTVYSNDRYLDNTLLDVGEVSGETDIYGSAAGFGYSFGGDLEYPFSTNLSLLLSGVYEHDHFGSSGTVREPSESPSGQISLGNSVHTFEASIDYARIAAALKLSLSRFYLMMGLSVGHPVTSSLDRRRTFGESTGTFPGTGQGTIEESGEIPSISSLHYAFRLGGGLIYRLTEHIQFSPELTLDFGSNKINKSPNSDIGIYTLSAVLRYDI